MSKAVWGADPEFFGPRHAHREDRILRRLRRAESEPGLHLECAAGVGSLALALAREGRTVVAADLSLRSLDILGRRSEASGFGPAVLPVVADITQLPFPNRIFVSATSAETLEHIPEHTEAVGELARILAPVCRVAYLHGEIAAPAAGAVPGTWRTFVPLQSTAAGLQASGVEHTALSITGLVVEPALLARAESAFRARRERLAGRAPLCIAFFTSGAYPKPHVRLIVAGTGSCLAAGHRVIVFTGCNPDESGRLRRRLPATTRSLQVITSVDRQQETDRTAELLPQIDLIAAAAHERTNWAAGLGLPLLTLRPDIGPFAPLNRAFAEQNGVSRPLDNDGAETLGSDLTRLRDSGVLTTMADSGHGRFAVDGAARVARHLLDAATR